MKKIFFLTLSLTINQRLSSNYKEHIEEMAEEEYEYEQKQKTKKSKMSKNTKIILSAAALATATVLFISILLYKNSSSNAEEEITKKMKIEHEKIKTTIQKAKEQVQENEKIIIENFENALNEFDELHSKIKKDISNILAKKYSLFKTHNNYIIENRTFEYEIKIEYNDNIFTRSSKENYTLEKIKNSANALRNSTINPTIKNNIFNIIIETYKKEEEIYKKPKKEKKFLQNVNLIMIYSKRFAIEPFTLN